MRRSGTPHGRPPGRPLFLALALAAALSGLLALTGCLSQAEREGVSRLPVNRPADWENQGPGTYTEGDL